MRATLRLMLLLVCVVAAVTAGCGNDDRAAIDLGGDLPGEEPQPAEATLGKRKADVDATIRAIWDAASIDPDDRFMFGYGRSSGKMSKPCMHLAEVDRWREFKASRLASGTASQDHVYDNTLRHLTDEGYTIERYVAAAPGVDAVSLRAVKDGKVITMDVEYDGNTTLSVSVGPCAETLVTMETSLYRRVD